MGAYADWFAPTCVVSHALASDQITRGRSVKARKCGAFTHAFSDIRLSRGGFQPFWRELRPRSGSANSQSPEPQRRSAPDWFGGSPNQFDNGGFGADCRCSTDGECRAARQLSSAGGAVDQRVADEFRIARTGIDDQDPVAEMRSQFERSIRSCSAHRCGRARARFETVRSPGAEPLAIALTMRGELKANGSRNLTCRSARPSDMAI